MIESVFCEYIIIQCLYIQHVDCESSLDYLWKVMTSRRDSWGLEERKYHFKMKHKEDLNKVSFALFPGKVTEKIFLETISKGKLVVWISRHG